MKFEWDPQKASSNLDKHHVSFDEASRVFLDMNRIESFDGSDAYGEDRWKTVGLVDVALLAVLYTVRGKDADIIRLISERKADRNEREEYGQV